MSSPMPCHWERGGEGGRRGEERARWRDTGSEGKRKRGGKWRKGRMERGKDERVGWGREGGRGGERGREGERGGERGREGWLVLADGFMKPC